MFRSLRGRISYANVIATIALFVALGGSSYAALQLPRNSVGPKQLKRNAVTATKIKRNAVTTAKVKNNAVTGEKINEGTLGKVNSATAADTAGSAPVSRLDYRQTTVPLPDDGPVVTRASVNCDTGLNATGGGAKVSNPDAPDTFIVDTNPVGRTAWEATGYAGVGGVTLTVYVICAQAASTTP
jgi:hypothetical protein